MRPRTLAVVANPMSGVGVFRAEARKNQDFILVFRSKLSIIDQYWNGSRPAANRPLRLVDFLRPRRAPMARKGLARPGLSVHIGSHDGCSPNLADRILTPPRPNTSLLTVVPAFTLTGLRRLGSNLFLGRLIHDFRYR